MKDNPNIYIPANTHLSRSTLEKLNNQRLIDYLDKVISTYLTEQAPFCSLFKLQMSITSHLEALKQRKGVRSFEVRRLEDQVIVEIEPAQAQWVITVA